LATRSTISLDSIVTVAADQISCDLDGEAAILNLKSGTYHGLDPVGATVWSLLAAPITVREIADAMLTRYEVDRARCERDLIELLGKLAERGLIEVGNGRAG
jgi:Coenzyme PQQ synthesis protein D (PqqD)